MSCKCGSNCRCGSNCSCEMYADVKKISSVIQGVAPAPAVNMQGEEGSEKSSAAEGCNCGSSCSCNPCRC